MPNLFDIDDLWPDDYDRVLELATDDTVGPVLAGHGVALLFEKPSARTRNSTEMAVVGLGGHPVYIQGAEVGLDVRESAEDMARTLACYHRVLCARVFDHTCWSAWPTHWRARASRCRDQPALRCRPPVPGHRRHVDAPRDRWARWPGAPGLHRRRQQHGPLGGQGGAHRGHGCPGGLARRLLVFGRGTVDQAARVLGWSGRAHRHDRGPGSPPQGSTPSTPTCGPAWGRRPRRPAAWPLSPVSRSTTRCSTWPSPTSWCCTACRPTGAKRSRPRSSKAPTGWCGVRPPIARRPCTGFWPGPWRVRR